MNNIKKQYEHAPQCFPNTNWLELSYIDFKNSKLEKTLLKKKQSIAYTKDKAPTIQYDSLYASLHVGKTEIWATRDTGLSFIADDVLYGPFKGI